MKLRGHPCVLARISRREPRALYRSLIMLLH